MDEVWTSVYTLDITPRSLCNSELPPGVSVLQRCSIWWEEASLGFHVLIIMTPSLLPMSTSTQDPCAKSFDLPTTPWGREGGKHKLDFAQSSLCIPRAIQLYVCRAVLREAGEEAQGEFKVVAQGISKETEETLFKEIMAR
jgi:hypothetical protein